MRSKRLPRCLWTVSYHATLSLGWHQSPPPTLYITRYLDLCSRSRTYEVQPHSCPHWSACVARERFVAAWSLKLQSDPVIELQPTTNLQLSSRPLRQSIAICLELHQYARRLFSPLYFYAIAATIGPFILQRYSTLADHPSPTSSGRYSVPREPPLALALALGLGLSRPPPCLLLPQHPQQ